MKATKTPKTATARNGKTVNAPAPAPALELEEDFAFDSRWPFVPSFLLVDSKDQFYLSYDSEGEDKEAVSLAEAFEWYCKCLPFSDGSVGDLENLCRVVSKQLRASTGQVR